jgi:hypothetical protein
MSTQLAALPSTPSPASPRRSNGPSTADIASLSRTPRFECQAFWLLLQVGLWWRELNRSLWFYVRDALDTGNTSELPGPSQDSHYAQSI